MRYFFNSKIFDNKDISVDNNTDCGDPVTDIDKVGKENEETTKGCVANFLSIENTISVDTNSV